MKRTPAQQRAIESTAPNILVVAGPGSGKTATTVERIRHLVEHGVDPRGIVALTFTNNAARELERRLATIEVQVGWLRGASPLKAPEPAVVETAIDQSKFPIGTALQSAVHGLGFTGTLHGFALKMLKRHGASLGYGERTAIIDAEAADDLIESKAQTLGCKTRLADLLKLKAEGVPMTARPTPEQLVIRGYYDDLREAGMVDFDTLLTEFQRLLSMKYIEGIARFTHLFVDEVQDSGLTDWNIYASLPMPHKFMVGDPDQCQPEGTLVRLADGYCEKKIEDLRPGDEIMTYDRHSKVLVKNGTVGQISKRPYNGLLYSVSAGGKTSCCTGNHRWLIRWRSGEQRRAICWCTYIMRRGDNFRIGKTKMFRSGGARPDSGHVLGVALRLNQERADHAWILKVHATEQEAFIHEEVTAATYGLPQACFLASNVSPHFDQPSLDAIFKTVPNQLRNATRCLQDHGRDLSFPLIDRTAPRTRRTVQEIQACNLLSDVMFIPVAPEFVNTKNRAGNWQPVSVTSSQWNGMVYSLDVPVHHKYVADGLVTCNSIYSFRGGDVSEMMKVSQRQDFEVIQLEQNFRSHSEICDAANRLIGHNTARIDKRTISEKGPGGYVIVIPEAVNEGDETAKVVAAILDKFHPEDADEIAVLARTNAIAAAFRKQLKASGIPVDEPARSTMPKDWPLARALVDLLVNPENDTLAFFYILARKLARGEAPGVARMSAHQIRQGAARDGLSINQAVLHLQPIKPELVVSAFVGAGISREAQMLTAARLRELPADAEMIDLALSMASREPVEKTERQGVTVTTIHAAKGLEFDVVFLVGFDDEVIPGRAGRADPVEFKPMRGDTYALPAGIGQRNDPLEEERRLAYVAVTRARRALYISSAGSRTTSWGATEGHTPSRFIEELRG